MTGKKGEARSAAQRDLFVPYIADLPLRDQRETMERPFFALTKRKRLTPIDYRSPDGSVVVQVEPHIVLREKLDDEGRPARGADGKVVRLVDLDRSHGMATIWDLDILIWAASQVADHMNRRQNEPPPRTLSFNSYDLLRTIHRKTGGAQYQQLQDSLNRLKFTAIKTNIRRHGEASKDAFSWIDDWSAKEDAMTGKCRGMTVTLSDWVYSSLTQTGGVLQILPAYFDLTGGFERWLYRIARKHAGGHGGRGVPISITTLYKKSGSDGSLRRFRHEIKQLVKQDELPEFHLEWIEKTTSGDQAVHFTRRDCLHPTHSAYAFLGKKDRRLPAALD